MNKDLGFFVISLENNIFHEKICDLIETYISNNRDKQIVIFNQYCEKINTNSIPMLPLSASKFFDGDIVTFDIISLMIAMNSVNAKSVYFYAQNIPWEISYNNYSEWNNIFKRENIKIISNSKNIHDIYNIAWNNSLGICEDVTYEKFSQFVR